MRGKILFLSLLFFVQAWGAPLAQRFNFDGILLDGSSNPITSLQTITFTIYNPAADCLLYEETQNVTPDSNGNFSVQVGAGTPTGNNPGLTFPTIFQNSGQVRGVGANCGSGYTAAGGHGRLLRVDVGGTPLTPDFQISPVPMANVAESIQGLTPANLLQTGTGNLTQADLQTVFSAANFAELINILAGTSTQYAPRSTTAATTLPGYTTGSPPGAPVAGSIWYDTTANTVKFYNGSATQTLSSGGGTVTSVSAGTGLAGGPITTTGSLSLASSGVTPGTYAKVTVDTYGRVTTGAALAVADLPGSVVLAGGQVAGGAMTLGTTDNFSLTLLTNNASSFHITNTGLVGIGTLTPQAKLEVAGTDSILVPRGTTGQRSGSPIDGMIRYNTTTLKMEAYQNGSWVDMVNSGGTLGGMTAGRIPYAASASSLTDTANLFWDNTNTRLGVGTNTPGATLDVNGEIFAKDRLNFFPASNNYADAAAGMIFGSVVGGGSYPFTENGNLVMVSGQDGAGRDIVFATGSTNATRMIVDRNGNVGIGTTSPGAKLHVNTSFRFQDGSEAAGFFLTSDASGNASWTSLPPSVNPSSANTWTSGNQIINNSGAAQIGMTINGFAGQTASLFDLKINGGSPIYSFTPTTFALSTWVDQIVPDGHNSANPVHNIINNDVTPGQGHGLNITAGNGASDASLIVYPRIGGTPLFLVRADGKIGMGVSTPSAGLHLQPGTVSANSAPLKISSGPVMTTPEVGAIEFDGTNLYFSNNTPVRKTLATITDLANVVAKAGDTMTGNLVVPAGTAAVPSLQVGTANSGLFSPSVGVLSISTGGAERVTVDASGNVGVGTTSPTHTMHVSSSALAPFKVESTSAAAALNLRRSGPVDNLLKVADIGGFGVMQTDITMDGTYEFTVQQNGSLGRIGVNNDQPGAVAHIMSDGSAPAMIAQVHNATPTTGAVLEVSRARGTLAAPTAVQNGDTLGGITIKGYGTTFANSAAVSAVASETHTAPNHGSDLNFLTTQNGGGSLTTKMTLTNSGNLALGTSTPSDKLTIHNSGATSAFINVGVLGTNATQQAGLIIETKSNGSTPLGAGGAVNRGWQFYGNSDAFTPSGIQYPNDLGLVFWDGASWQETIRFDANGDVKLERHLASELGGRPAPTMGACGGGPAALLLGNPTDVRGTVRTGGGAPTSCIINFGTSYNAGFPPICVVTWAGAINTASMSVATTITSLTVTFDVGQTVKDFNYICME